jgi:hypothetical protein
MKAIAWSLVILACVACNKPAADALPPAAVAPSEPPPAAAAPEPAPDDADQPMDAAKAKAFVAYQEKFVPLVEGWKKGLAEGAKKQQEGKYNGAVGMVRGYADLQAAAGEADKLEALRKETGLSEDQVTALFDIEAHVLGRNAGVGPQIAAKIEEVTKSIAALPADQRPAAEQSLDELKKLQVEVLELKEEREKYGNAIVDAMIAEQANLVRQSKALADASK